MPGSVLPGCREELKLRPFSIPSHCPLQMTGVKETNRHCCSPRVFSREFTQAHSPPWHGTELTFLPSGYHLVTERWCAGGHHSSGCDTEILTPFISAWWARLLAARRGGFFPVCTALLQPHYAGSQSFGLTGMKIIKKKKKITPLCIPNPELLALFCLTGKDKETTTPQWPRLT